MDMMSIKRLLKNDRSMRALTGMDRKRFEELLVTFERCFLEDRAERKVRVNHGRTHHLRTPAEKLGFILFYLKTYPTYDLAAAVYDADKHRIFDWIHEYMRILQKALRKKIVLPKRKIRTMEEFLEFFPETKEVLMDGTERPIRRPKNKRKQKNRYSGKKKRHTVKNLVLTDKKKRILLLTSTRVGKRHDYKLFKEAKIPACIPKDVTVFMDTGFEGTPKDYPDLSIKKPKRANRGKPLSSEEKAENKIISKERILVEHGLSGIKRYRCTTDVNRNMKDLFRDKLMLLSAGLWNFYLQAA